MHKKYEKFGLKCETLPEAVISKMIQRNFKKKRQYYNSQCVFVPSFLFDKLNSENVYYRDENSVWVVANISDENNIEAGVKQFLPQLKAIASSTKKIKDGSSGPRIYSKRIVQIIPSNRDETTVYMNELELFNIKQNVYSDDLRLKFSSILSENQSPKIASQLVVQMVLMPINIGLDLTDQMLMNYFKRPRFLHLNDFIRVDTNVEYTNHLHYKYFNALKHVKRIYFKCVSLIAKDHSIESNSDVNVGYFVVLGKTELKQNQNFNSFIPRCQYLTFSDSQDEGFIENCPYGLNNIFDQLKTCIEPFLVPKEVNLLNTQIKCTLQPLFLLRSDVGSGHEVLARSLCDTFGLHFITETCRRLLSSTAKQTESKIEALIQRIKKSCPVLVLLQDFEMFGLESDNSEDVRVVECFIKKLNDLFLSFDKHPIIFFFSCDPSHEFKLNLKRLFLDEAQIHLPTAQERLDLLIWLCLTKNIRLFKGCDDKIGEVCETDTDSNATRRDLLVRLFLGHKFVSVLKKVASKTEGYNFGDMDSLLDYVMYNSSLTNKVDSLTENVTSNNLVIVKEEDFLQSLEIMRKLHSKKYGSLRIPNVDWEDIGGLEELKKEIFRTIELPLKYPHLLANTGLKRSGLLLWGPPGCGKTLVARAIASQLKATFLSVKGPELLDMYVGQSEKNMRDIFSAARSSAPCVIFLDEAEAVAGARGASGDAGGAADRLVSQLLAELDGVASVQHRDKAPIVVIAATNRPDLVEPALLRPGRLDKLLYVGPYEGLTNKVRVMKAVSRSFNIDKDVDLNTIAEQLPDKCTGADLASVINNSRRRALVRTIRKVENGDIEPSALSESDVMIESDDFVQSLKEFTSSVSAAEMSHYESLRLKLS